MNFKNHIFMFFQRNSMMVIVDKKKTFFSITSHTASYRFRIFQIHRPAIRIYRYHGSQVFSEILQEFKYCL